MGAILMHDSTLDVITAVLCLLPLPELPMRALVHAQYGSVGL